MYKRKIGLTPSNDLFKKGVNMSQFDGPDGADFERAKEIIEEQIEEVMNESDVVNAPSHYKGGRVEVIDFIEDYVDDFRLANVIKYIARAGKKNPEKYEEDLKKAQWYLNRYIEKEFDS